MTLSERASPGFVVPTSLKVIPGIVVVDPRIYRVPPSQPRRDSASCGTLWTTVARVRPETS